MIHNVVTAVRVIPLQIYAQRLWRRCDAGVINNSIGNITAIPITTIVTHSDPPSPVGEGERTVGRQSGTSDAGLIIDSTPSSAIHDRFVIQSPVGDGDGTVGRRSIRGRPMQIYAHRVRRRRDTGMFKADSNGMSNWCNAGVTNNRKSTTTTMPITAAIDVVIPSPVGDGDGAVGPQTVIPKQISVQRVLLRSDESMIHDILATAAAMTGAAVGVITSPVGDADSAVGRHTGCLPVGISVPTAPVGGGYNPVRSSISILAIPIKGIVREVCLSAGMVLDVIIPANVIHNRAHTIGHDVHWRLPTVAAPVGVTTL